MPHSPESALGAIPLFAELERPQLERVLEVATEVDFPARSVLIERDHPGSGLFVILDGTVAVEVPYGTVELGPNEVVGELSLLVDVPRSARVYARTPVRCLAIARAEFTRLLEAEPRIALPLLGAVARRLAETLRAGRP